MTKLIAGIAVENSAYSFDRIFDYDADAFSDSIAVGKRVLVPFGNGNRKRQGMVMYLKSAETDGLKSVLSVLDREPVLPHELVKLVGFMKEHYFCTYYLYLLRRGEGNSARGYQLQYRDDVLGCEGYRDR